MKQSKWVTRFACVLLIAGTIAGVALAAGTPGTQENPLVTLDYLNQVIEKLKEQTDAQIAAKTDELLENIEEHSGSFILVSAEQGQNLYLNAGSQIVLCSGAATSPGGILNSTMGEITSGELSQNSLYIAVGDNHRIAVTEKASFLIFGTYTIS